MFIVTQAYRFEFQSFLHLELSQLVAEVEDDAVKRSRSSLHGENEQ